MSRRTKLPATYWIFALIFLIHAIGFLISHFREDVHGMVWYGFMSMLWFLLAEREGKP